MGQRSFKRQIQGVSHRVLTFALLVNAIILGLLTSQLLNPDHFVAFVVSIALLNCCIIKENITNDFLSD